MTEQPGEEAQQALTKTDVSDTEETANERRKIQKELLLERLPWQVFGQWDPREITGA